MKNNISSISLIIHVSSTLSKISDNQRLRNERHNLDDYLFVEDIYDTRVIQTPISGADITLNNEWLSD